MPSSTHGKKLPVTDLRCMNVTINLIDSVELLLFHLDQNMETDNNKIFDDPDHIQLMDIDNDFESSDDEQVDDCFDEDEEENFIDYWTNTNEIIDN